MYLGDIPVNQTIDFTFTTSSGGTPTALTSGAVSVYKANGTTQTTTGVTLTADFDSVTGLNHVRIATTDSLYVGGDDYSVILTGGTVGGVSVAGHVIAHFSIQNRFALDDGAIYVRADGDDTNGDGSPQRPYATIEPAHTAASTNDTIDIGVGEFEVDFRPTKYVHLRGAGKHATRLIPSNPPASGQVAVWSPSNGELATFEDLTLDNDGQTLACVQIYTPATQRPWHFKNVHFITSALPSNVLMAAVEMQVNSGQSPALFEGCTADCLGGWIGMEDVGAVTVRDCYCFASSGIVMANDVALLHVYDSQFYITHRDASYTDIGCKGISTMGRGGLISNTVIDVTTSTASEDAIGIELQATSAPATGARNYTSLSNVRIRTFATGAGATARDIVLKDGGPSAASKHHYCVIDRATQYDPAKVYTQENDGIENPTYTSTVDTTKLLMADGLTDPQEKPSLGVPAGDSVSDDILLLKKIGQAQE